MRHVELAAAGLLEIEPKIKNELVSEHSASDGKEVRCMLKLLQASRRSDIMTLLISLLCSNLQLANVRSHLRDATLASSTVPLEYLCLGMHEQPWASPHGMSPN